jgi:hypothetical protein
MTDPAENKTQALTARNEAARADLPSPEPGAADATLREALAAHVAVEG